MSKDLNEADVSQEAVDSPSTKDAEVEEVTEEEQEDSDYYRQRLEELKAENDGLRTSKDRLIKDLRNRKRKQSNPEEESYESTAEPDSSLKQEILELLDEKTKVLEAQYRRKEYNAELDRISRNLDDREALDIVYHSHIRHTGDFQVDLEHARAIVDKDKIQQAARKRVDDAHQRSVRKDNATALAGGKSNAGRKGSRSKTTEIKYTGAEQGFAEYVANEKRRAANIAKATGR